MFMDVQWELQKKTYNRLSCAGLRRVSWFLLWRLLFYCYKDASLYYISLLSIELIASVG